MEIEMNIEGQPICTVRIGFNSRSLYYLFQVGKEKGKGEGREDEETQQGTRIGKGLKLYLNCNQITFQQKEEEEGYREMLAKEAFQTWLEIKVIVIP